MGTSTALLINGETAIEFLFMSFVVFGFLIWILYLVLPIKDNPVYIK